MQLITPEILRKICPTLPDIRANDIAALINELCPEYGIDNTDKLEEFLANIAHESGEFRIKTESMTYTTAQRIVDVWPSRFNLTGADGKKNANDYVKNPIKLANEVYNGRMGNATGSNDGFTYRGGGFMQLTGKESYAQYANYLNKDVEETAALVRTKDYYAMDSALWEYSVVKKLVPLSIGHENFKYIVKSINGGFIGLPERQKYYERCQQYLSK